MDQSKCNMKKTNKQLAEGLKDLLSKTALTDVERDVVFQSMHVLGESTDPFSDFLGNFFPQESPIILVEHEADAGVLIVHRANGDISQFQGSASGSGAIAWYKMPMMTPVSEAMDKRLNEILTYVQKWKGPYPVAHVKRVLSETK